MGYWRELAGKAGEERMCLGREELRSQGDEGKGRDDGGKRRKGEDRVDELCDGHPCAIGEDSIHRGRFQQVNQRSLNASPRAATSSGDQLFLLTSFAT